MGQINWGRVFGGGLAAGLVINIGETVLNTVLLAKEAEEAMKRMNLQPPGLEALSVFVVLGFVLGILLVWLYAAIRPRYGPGPKTGLCAGLAVWAFWYLPATLQVALTGMYPLGLAVVAALWGMGEILLAAMVGGYLYKET